MARFPEDIYILYFVRSTPLLAVMIMHTKSRKGSGGMVVLRAHPTYNHTYI
jgi:hypothetical protein